MPIILIVVTNWKSWFTFCIIFYSSYSEKNIYIFLVKKISVEKKYMFFSDGSGTQNLPKNEFMWQVKQGISSFSAIFFVDYSKFCSTFGTLNFEKSSNISQKIWQKWKTKTFSPCLLNPFLHDRHFQNLSET